MQVEPKFHEGASNLEELVPFEECIELHSSEKAVVRAPDFLLLTHNGRSFKLVSTTSMCLFFCLLIVHILALILLVTDFCPFSFQICFLLFFFMYKID